MAWVRGPHTASGLSLTTTELRSALEPSFTVRIPGNPLDSQYEPTLPSLAFVATNVNTEQLASTGLPRARFVPFGAVVAGRVTRVLSWARVPAASASFT